MFGYFECNVTTLRTLSMPCPLSKYGSRRKTRVKSVKDFMITAKKKAEKFRNNLSSLKNPRAARTKRYLLLLCFERNPLWQK
jgi:hypothetical protein